MSDPVADLLTRVRNAQSAGKVEVSMPSSRVKYALAKLLHAEGYVGEVKVDDNQGKPLLSINLKYFQGKPVIESINRVSTPGLRVYKGCNELPKIQGGLGIAIISTSKGLMTDRASRAAGQGGEVVATVY
jgi:small subunit ribosomal protein S8